MYRCLCACFLFAVGCTSGRIPPTPTQDQSAVSISIASPADVSHRFIDDQLGTLISSRMNTVADPNTERAIGYIVLVTGVVVITFLLVGLFKLAGIL